MASNPIDPSQPPRIKDFVFRRFVDTAPAPQACGTHPEAKPRRVLRARWICPACVGERAAG